MPSPLEKARQAPESMKGRILSAARQLFGDYGFHGVTTRMIAKEVGIDISTLYYHCGEKQDLYEAIEEELGPKREAYLEIRGDEPRLDALLHEGADKARQIADLTMARVRSAIGIE